MDRTTDEEFEDLSLGPSQSFLCKSSQPCHKGAWRSRHGNTKEGIADN